MATLRGRTTAAIIAVMDTVAAMATADRAYRSASAVVAAGKETEKPAAMRAFTMLLCAASALAALLNRRAWHRTIRAEDATISFKWLQPLPTTLAIIEELTGIRRHRFSSLMGAPRTGQGRFQLHYLFALTILRSGRSSTLQLAAVMTINDDSARTAAVLLAPPRRK